MRRLFGTFIVIVATTGATRSQQTEPATTFDVASIKKNETGRGLAVVTLQPSGRVSAGNMTVRELMLTAYGLEDIQLIGTPAWAAADRFEIEARTNGTNGETSSEQIRQMLRALLAERFALQAHRETRELPVLALVRARADGKAGERPPASADAPPLFTALQEQLGLKLDAQRAPVSVLVIDRVEKPTEN